MGVIDFIGLVLEDILAWLPLKSPYVISVFKLFQSIFNKMRSSTPSLPLSELVCQN